MSSRRLFLFSLASLAVASNKGRISPSAIIRYADRATEFPVVRLTDPAHSSFMPPAFSRAVSRRGNFLIYASDMTGQTEAYRMDLKAGTSRQLTEAEKLDPASMALSADERTLYVIDAGRLMALSLSTLRSREIYSLPDGYQPGAGPSISEDGIYAALVERRDKNNRLQLIRLVDGSARTLAESAEEEFREPVMRPRRASVLYRRAGAVWLANFDGKQNYRLRLADGTAGPATWSPDGRSVLYLNLPAQAGKLNNLREFTPDTNDDKLVAETSQFVDFGPNGDASVFVGASGSKASPYILLLVRAVRRELSLCEHRASDPSMVNPVFSPNSQRIFFTSDMHGKPAIYSMEVEKFVTETSDEQ